MVLRRLYRTCVWDLMLLVQTVIGADFRGPLSHNLARKSGEEEGRTSILALDFLSLLTYMYTGTHRVSGIGGSHIQYRCTSERTSSRCSLVKLSCLLALRHVSAPVARHCRRDVLQRLHALRSKRLSGEGVQQCQRVDAGEALFLPAWLAGGISYSASAECVIVTALLPAC